MQSMNPATANSRKPSIWGRPVLLYALTVLFGSFAWLGMKQLDLDIPQSWDWPSKLICMGIGFLVAMLFMTACGLKR